MSNYPVSLGSSSSAERATLPAVRSQPVQLISDKPEFNERVFEVFLSSLNPQTLHQHAVVAIMGPQTSGKSTLLNHLFNTNFIELDEVKGRHQETKGIWIAKALEIERSTIVLDLEGSDGKERGQDDTILEKQFASFGLIVADIILINMWCHNIGLENAGGRPLLIIIFKIMLHLSYPRKRTLVFVLRDKTKTPIPILENQLKEDVEMIWETVVQHHRPASNIHFTEIFNVEFSFLSSYERTEDTFKEEVAKLRRDICTWTSSMVINQDVLTSWTNSKAVWEAIQGYTGHEFISHKVMFATVKCGDIVKNKLSHFESNMDWLALQEATKTGSVSGFAERVKLLFDTYLSEYDVESINEEKEVRREKRQYLESELLRVLQSAYMNILGHLRSEELERFKTHLDAQWSEVSPAKEKLSISVRKCKQKSECMFNRNASDHASIHKKDWEASTKTVFQELANDLNKHVEFFKDMKLKDTLHQAQMEITNTLASNLANIINHMDMHEKDIWDLIKKTFTKKSDICETKLRKELYDIFELDHKEVVKMVDSFKICARGVVVTTFRELEGNVSDLIKKRFIIGLQKVEKSTPLSQEDKAKIYDECLDMLSTLAVIRLDKTYDNVGELLRSALIDARRHVAISPDPLASNIWKEVPSEMTVITPAKCKILWDKFKLDMELELANAEFIRVECNKKKKYRQIRFWTIVGLSIFGVTALAAFIGAASCGVPLILLSGVAAGVLISDGAAGIYTYIKTGEKINEKEIDNVTLVEKYPDLLKNYETDLRKDLDCITDVSKNSSCIISYKS